MKGKIIFVICCLTLIVSQFAFSQRYYKGQRPEPPKQIRVASCDTCSSSSSSCGTDTCAALEGCGGWGGCGEDMDSPCGSCNCVDPRCGRNPCLSARRCCQAFGNIGASDLSDDNFEGCT
jgi:hypothetical protein